MHHGHSIVKKSKTSRFSRIAEKKGARQNSKCDVRYNCEPVASSHLASLIGDRTRSRSRTGPGQAGCDYSKCLSVSNSGKPES